MPSTHAQSSSSLSIPMTSAVLEAMNVFATTGAFATLLVVAGVTLAWRSAVQDSPLWGVVSGALFLSAVGLFLSGRAKLLAAFERACTDEGVPSDEAQRRARLALHQSLPRPRAR